MLAKAIENRDMALPGHLRGRVRDGTDDPRFPFEVGRTYVVYAVATWGKCICFAICDNDYTAGGYPVMYPGSLFTVVDTRMPSCWEFQYRCSGKGDDWYEQFMMAFPEWVNDARYYDDLVEGEKPAVRIFLARKAAIDQEAVALLGGEERADILGR